MSFCGRHRTRHHGSRNPSKLSLPLGRQRFVPVTLPQLRQEITLSSIQQLIEIEHTSNHVSEQTGANNNNHGKGTRGNETLLGRGGYESCGNFNHRHAGEKKKKHHYFPTRFVVTSVARKFFRRAFELSLFHTEQYP